MKLILTNVGRDKWNGSIDIPDNASPDGVAEFAYREAKKRLATRYPDTEYNATTNKGIIMSGFHITGEFHLEKPN